MTTSWMLRMAVAGIADETSSRLVPRSQKEFQEDSEQ